MTENQWKELLQTYKSPRQVALESLEGIDDHLAPCNRGHVQMVRTPRAGAGGLPPFHEEPLVCSRGSKGCNFEHNDLQALRFAKLAFDRIVEI